MDVKEVIVQSHLLKKSASEVNDLGKTPKNLSNLRREIDNSSVNEDLPKEEYEERIRKVVEGINQLIDPQKTSLKFKFHEELEEYYVSIIDERSGDIVREIPPKKVLDYHAAMEEFLGIIIDNKI
ncbi:flagellar protein FlaG [Halobacillus litoralis]|uniref:flagellar protein FlaG n=1 Tax=Halobacillus litoralis TaxID=45668 RepID=UPI001CD35021|nr:flagellar protein FlaG [Halobacillus litoralis]MCA0971576.1 flagellar protein FlaG [Halobacillus litoralis]